MCSGSILFVQLRSRPNQPALRLQPMESDLRQYSCSCKMQHDYCIYVMFGIDHVELGMSQHERLTIWQAQVDKQHNFYLNK